MGIKNLMKLINDEAPGCVKDVPVSSYTGRTVAVDASMSLYQFLIAVRTQGAAGAPAGVSTALTNENGEDTSHIQGIFNRTIKMLGNGVKPIYVFDGKPPEFKSHELEKRTKARKEAQQALEAAKEAGDAEAMDKYSTRLTKVTRKHNEDTKRLLTLMGVPYVDAPCEAEAQCCELALKGKVYGVATEDMDALTFRAPKLLRKLAGGFVPSKGAKQEVMEIDYAKMIAGLGVTEEQFVDVCILCGCDYTDTVRGVGPKKALELIKEHGDIERALRSLDRAKYGIPASWLPKAERAAAARELAAGNAERAKKLAAKKAKEARKAARLAGEDGAAADDDGGAAAPALADGADDAVLSAETDDEMDADDDGYGAAASEDDDGYESGAEARRAAVAAEAAASEPVAAGSSDAPPFCAASDTPMTAAAPSAPTSVETAAPGPETEAGPSGSAGESSKRKADDEANADEEEEEEDDEADDDEWVPMYQQARKTFMEHEVIDGDTFDFKFQAPQEAELTDFLVKECGFNVDRVANGIKKLKEARGAVAQKRMDSFFKVTAAPSATNKPNKAAPPPAKGKGAKGKGSVKAGGGKPRR